MLALVATALVPAAAHAQSFGGVGYGRWGNPYGAWGGYGGWGGGYPYGGWGGGYPYGGGYGGYPYGGWGYPPSSTTIAPIVYSVTGNTGDLPARARPALWPAIPYRDREGSITPASTTSSTQAQIDVRVPTASAEVFFDGVEMKQGGTDRHFVTPALDAGSTYTFEIRARWRDAGGKEVTRTRSLDLRAGDTRSVDFTSAQ
jgi:uncharacterized protein (TIGR03000 family)